MWDLIKNSTKELIHKTETINYFESKLMVTEGENTGGRDKMVG